MIDLVEVLRAKAESQNWVFNYGRRDFQNLIETESENDPKWYFFLDPISSEKNKSTILNNGYFMVLSKSTIDENYDSENNNDPENGKFRKNILPKKQFIQNEFKQMLECEGNLDLTKFSITDVINFFDDNLDGIIVNFSITQYP